MTRLIEVIYDTILRLSNTYLLVVI